MEAADTRQSLYTKLHRALEWIYYIRHASALRNILEEDIDVIKNIPYETLIEGREDFIKEHRTRTSAIFDYKLNYSLKGFENKVIKLHNNSLYLTVTNLPQLRYLDLPVHEFNLTEHYRNIIHISQNVFDSYNRKRDHYLIDYKRSYPDPETWFGDLPSIYIEDVREMLEEVYENNEIMSLLMCWDAERFKKFLDFYIHRPPTNQLYYIFYTLITILERNTTDSELIAESFRKMCMYCEYRNFSSFLPANYINFMMKHLKLSAKGPEPFGQHQEWLSSENLVAKKFFRGDKSSLKLLLRYKCPTIFHPSYVNNFFPDDFLPGVEYWPRELAGCTSFNSLKYHVYLTCLIMKLLRWSTSAKEEDITDCIRLLWASLPTPIIPIADTQEFLLKLSEHVRWWETSTYLRYFPLEYDTVYQNRSLQHLSRYAFVQNCYNPEGISSLDLPKILKCYLKFDKNFR